MSMSTFVYSSIMEEDSGLPQRFSAFISSGSQGTTVHYVLRDGRILIVVVCGLN